jgi:hypothetical protein
LRRINLEGNTQVQESNVSQLPVQLSLSQLAKILGPSYYCLHSLFNKSRHKGKIVSAWKLGGSRGDGDGGVAKGGGRGKGREMTQTLYVHMNFLKNPSFLKRPNIHKDRYKYIYTHPYIYMYIYIYIHV